MNMLDIDVLMGTFTKSFGAAGGYIAGKKDLVTALRQRSHAETYAVSMSPPVCAQIIASMRTIMGKTGGDEGRRRIRQLAENAKFFRTALKQMGLMVYGNDASPVVPFLILLPGKIAFVPVGVGGYHP